MKKLCSLIVSAMIVLTSAVSIHATNETDIERVLASVRARIGSTEKYTEFSSESYTYDSKTVYDFNWSTESGGDYSYMYVTATGNGVITSYGCYGNTDGEVSSKFDRPSLDEAMKKAKTLIDALNPDLSEKILISANDGSESFYDDAFYFNLEHIENSVPVSGDGGFVCMDLNCEKLRSFNINLTDDALFPSPEGCIGISEAKNAFTEKIGMELVYMKHYNYKERKTSVFPAYIIKDSNTYIDAFSGENIKIEDYNTFYGRNEAVKERAVSDSAGGFSPAERAELDNLKNLIGEKNAEKAVRSSKYLGVTNDYTLSSVNVWSHNDTKKTYTYSMEFTKETNNDNSYIYVTLDAQNGDVLSYSRSYSYDVNEKVLDRDAVKKKADEIFAALFKENSCYKFSEATQNGCVYDRYENSVRVNGDSAYISFDPSDFSLSSYNVSYTSCDFPSVEGVISNKECCDRLFGTTTYDKKYILNRQEDSVKSFLVYAPGDFSIMLDAFSGARIGYDGEPYSDNGAIEEYTDIASHYGEEKINALRRFGIGFSGGLFKPDENILQKDFINLLISAKYGYTNNMFTDDSDLYDNAVNSGIIKKDEIKKDEIVTRLDGAKFICRAMGIDKCAEIEGIYICPFYDVTENVGYATLLKGLGIISGTSENTFSPSLSLTRAQAAIMVYNTMNAD